MDSIRRDYVREVVLYVHVAGMLERSSFEKAGPKLLPLLLTVLFH
jgi:hypothetical protein